MSEHPSRPDAAPAVTTKVDAVPPADGVRPTGPGDSARATGPGGCGNRRGSGRTALSPSRAKDFMQCPLLFRLRTVDRIPEPGSLATHKGTLVHAILERLYDLPARERTREAALAMLPGQWEAHREKNPAVMALFADPAQVDPWLNEARELVGAYFQLENPTRLEPAERELFVQAETRDGLLLRGFVDRLDVAPNGAMRVVDYKTGRSPGPRFQEEALFQMRFYALVLWRLRGRAPSRLQLVYLKDGRTLTHDPRLPELETTETKLARIWDEVEDCAAAGEFAPRRSRLCDWCAYHAQCPVFGGTTPELPADGVERLLTARRAPAA
ncbi:putative RecB family exonuclease [Actinomyces ruminicola]|uniref:Putative RecB family exonuclease n=1 Tax=Actinomyces ruminicola TaxID=332524 RepID=A0A1H0D6C9_9ACTO|nr:PD-(D/E)XK nuclease family protein [Actinomyces ruminicola]SDN65722.1 putative RecB family exonuclease [Actinomyces ruminicola]